MIRGTVTRVVLIDPHPVYRLGLEHVCASDAHVEVVGAVSTGVAGLRAIKALEPDVAVSEFDLPDQRGPALVEACRDAPISTPVMILTARRDGRDVYEALGAGASGYVLKSAEADFIRSAIESVASGETVIDLELHQSVAAEIRLNATCAQIDLTVREREVLGLVAQGYSSRQIGTQLYVSEATVKTHLGNMYEKLGVSSRAAAVAQAMKRGLVKTT